MPVDDVLAGFCAVGAGADAWAFCVFEPVFGLVDDVLDWWWEWVEWCHFLTRLRRVVGGWLRACAVSIW